MFYTCFHGTVWMKDSCPTFMISLLPNLSSTLYHPLGTLDIRCRCSYGLGMWHTHSPGTGGGTRPCTNLLIATLLSLVWVSCLLWPPFLDMLNSQGDGIQLNSYSDSVHPCLIHNIAHSAHIHSCIKPIHRIVSATYILSYGDSTHPCQSHICNAPKLPFISPFTHSFTHSHIYITFLINRLDSLYE